MAYENEGNMKNEFLADCEETENTKNDKPETGSAKIPAQRFVVATVDEMTEHCDKYPCVSCPISKRCGMYYALFGCR